MYTLSETKMHKEFKREFEGMGEGLALLKVESLIKSIGYNYHLFYRNGKKPPLDVAINPSDSMIEYVSFFLQDEFVERVQSEVNIEFKEESLSFSFENLSIDNTALNFQKDFSVQETENNLTIIEKGHYGKVYGYFLSPNNYILIDDERNIIGVNLKNISIHELDVLKQAKVINL